MYKWMLVVAVVCCASVNGMETNAKLAQDLLGKDALEAQCGTAWISEYSRRKWKSSEQVRQDTKETIAENLKILPTESKCMSILNTMRKFAFMPQEERKCKDPHYATALMTTEAFAETIDDEILNSVFAEEKACHYFRSICQEHQGAVKH